jgi:hypothetical protein
MFFSNNNKDAKKGPIYLFFSVNGSGHFCGVAQMTSAVDYSNDVRFVTTIYFPKFEQNKQYIYIYIYSVWAADKWKGQFTVKWLFVKGKIMIVVLCRY